MIVRLMLILRRRWPIVASLIVLGAVAGLLVGPTGPTRSTGYQAKAVVSVNGALQSKTEAQQDLIRARRGVVAQLVAVEQGGDATAESITRAIETEFDEESFVATITATGDTAPQAEALATAFARAFVTESNETASADETAQVERAAQARADADAALDAFLADHAAELEGPDPSAVLVGEQARLEQDLADAERRVEDLEAVMPTTTVYELVDVGTPSAVTPGKLAVLDQPGFRSLLGVVLGAIAAVLVILLAERTNPRIDDPATAMALVGAPALALVPRIGRRHRRALERVDAEAFTGPFAEAYRTMRSHLEFRAAAEARTAAPRLMVTSATPSEGKSTTAAFLSLAFTEAGRRTVAIGGDVRRPTLHRLFGVERDPGLTSRSRPEGRNLPFSALLHRDPRSGVTVIPSGPPTTSAIEVVNDLRSITEVARDAGQVVVLDTAPVRVANDAIDFLPAVDWVVVVVHVGRSTVRSVEQMMHVLRLNGAEVVGVALVGSAEAADASRDYYSYYAPDLRSRRERRREREPVAAAAARGVQAPAAAAAS